MAMDFPAPHVIPAQETHDLTIIFLHGRNSNGQEFQEELFEGETSMNKSLPGSLPASCRWVFPNAPLRYSSVFEEDLQEWFDIYSLSDPDEEWSRQTIGLEQSTGYIHKIILDELSHIPAHRLFLCGISQGFAVASHVLTTLPVSIGGFVGVSGWMPIKAIPITQQIHSLRTPVFISHSKGDPVVESRHGEAAAARLRELGYQVEVYMNEDDEHWISEPEGFDQLASFLNRCLGQA